eukprot:2186210-Prymnesium_polylepis.1
MVDEELPNMVLEMILKALIRALEAGKEAVHPMNRRKNTVGVKEGAGNHDMNQPQDNCREEDLRDANDQALRLETLRTYKTAFRVKSLLDNESLELQALSSGSDSLGPQDAISAVLAVRLSEPTAVPHATTIYCPSRVADDRKLTRLDLSKCHLGDAGIQQVAAALKKRLPECQAITSLDINGNDVTDQKVIDHFLQAVDGYYKEREGEPTVCRIQVTHDHDNRQELMLKNAHLEAPAMHILNWKCSLNSIVIHALKRIHLQSNNLDDKAAVVLANVLDDAVKKSQSAGIIPLPLEELDVRGNPQITIKGARKLVATVRWHTEAGALKLQKFGNIELAGILDTGGYGMDVRLSGAKPGRMAVGRGTNTTSLSKTEGMPSLLVLTWLLERTTTPSTSSGQNYIQELDLSGESTLTLQAARESGLARAVGQHYRWMLQGRGAGVS